MKQLIIVLVLLSYVVLYPQTISKVLISPEKPVKAEIVNIKYFPLKDLKLYNADSVFFQGYCYNSANKVTLVELPMKKNGEGYEINLDFKDRDYVCIKIRFGLNDGVTVDEERTNPWYIVYHEKDGRPLKNSYANLARFVNVPQQKMKYYEEEYKNNPTDYQLNYEMMFEKYSQKVDYSTHLKIAKTYLDSVIANSSAFAGNYYSASKMYTLIGDKEKAKKYMDEYNKLRPEALLQDRRLKVRSIKEFKARFDSSLALLKLVKGTDSEEYYTSDVLQYAPKAIDYNSFMKLLPDLKVRALPMVSDAINSYIAQATLKLKGAIERNSSAKNKLIKEIGVMREELLNSLKEYISHPEKSFANGFRSQVMSQLHLTMGVSYKTLGEAEYVMGNYEQAIKYFEMTEKYIPQDRAFMFPFVETHVKALIESTIRKSKDNDNELFGISKIDGKNERVNKAITLLLKSIDQLYDEKAVKLLMIIDKNISPKPDNLKAEVAKIKEKHLVERQKDILKAFKSEFKDAPDFEVKDLKGNTHKFSEFKGKIIVLEFWSVGCGWCYLSMDLLEKFYKAHSNDADLFVVGVNVDSDLENNQKKKEEKVKAFLKSKNYSFPNYIDFGNELNWGNFSSSLYGIVGVPTLVVIGPDNMIYFREGGYGGETLVSDLELIVNKIREANSK